MMAKTYLANRSETELFLEKGEKKIEEKYLLRVNRKVETSASGGKVKKALTHISLRLILAFKTKNSSQYTFKATK